MKTVRWLALVLGCALALSFEVVRRERAPTTQEQGITDRSYKARHSPMALVRMGVLTSDVRDRLAREWTDSLGQVERAYCGLWTAQLTIDGDSVFAVGMVFDAKSWDASVYRISMRCPVGSVPIHVHPPVTCTDDDGCRHGGVLAWQCFPSPIDVLYLQRNRGHAFGVVQCGRDQFVFYQPIVVLPPPKIVRDGTRAVPH